MHSFLVDEDRTIWLGLILSLLIHSLIFIFSKTTFIQRPQFSVEPSNQMVEVSLVSKEDQVLLKSQGVMTSEAKDLKRNITDQNTTKFKQAIHSISGIKVQANPNYFQNSPPEYPELAKQMHQEGIVVLSVDVSKEGDPLSVEIVKSSGYRLLDQAALKAVLKWKFEPGRIGSLGIESKVVIPIRFKLEG